MNSRASRIGLSAGAMLLCAASALAQGWGHLGDVDTIQKRPNGVELTSGPAKVRISVVCDGVIRVRVVPRGQFPDDASWAVIEKPDPPQISIQESEHEMRMRAGSVSVIVSKSPLLIQFADAAGNMIVEDERSLPIAWNGSRFRVWKKMPLNEHFYGLGDKAGPIDRRNRAFSLWNTDTPGWQESTDPLYKSVPFFLGLNHLGAYGIFLDNTYRTSFDFGTESADYYSFGAEGGVLDYYYIAGPDPKAVIRSYTALVGRIPLPPLWSLGYQQSRWSYYPEKRVREIASALREKKIPADTIYLDIDYQQGFAPFTINHDFFPDFEQMILDLKAQKFHLVLITDLHIKYAPNSAYKPLDSGIKADVFVKRADGSMYVAPVWPGDSVFPDFTLSRVRDWWGGLYKTFSDMGVTGFWNDMDEPSVFQTAEKTMPLDNLHRLDDGTTVQHRAVHNVYGMLNSRATFEGLLHLNPDERPFVLTRASYAGGQRYAATWTGDNVATWNHLAMSTSGLLSLGISGFSLVGDDIGGFASTPPADLLTRWFQVGAFNPIYRNHSSRGTGDHEPWVNGEEQEAIRRKFIEARYRLMPYIYTQVESSSRTGLPIMSPVFLQFPKLESFWNDDRDFFFGEALFVSPVVTESIDAHRVQLPPGAWFDYWTGEKYSDKEPLELHPKLNEMPLFVRAGSILPQQPLVQSTMEQPNGPLQLQVYSGSDCRGSLYQDDGHSMAYQRAEFLRIAFSCDEDSKGIRISSHVEKSGYVPWWDSMEIRVFGLQGKPAGIDIGTEKLSDWRFDAQTQSVSVTLSGGPRDWTLQILY